MSTLLAMPAARGLFHRAAIQSGPGIRANTRDAANALTKAMLAKLGLGSSRIDDLQTLPAETLLAAMKSVLATPGVRGSFGSRAKERPKFDWHDQVTGDGSSSS